MGFAGALALGGIHGGEFVHNAWIFGCCSRLNKECSLSS